MLSFEPRSRFYFRVQSDWQDLLAHPVKRLHTCFHDSLKPRISIFCVKCVQMINWLFVKNFYVCLLQGASAESVLVGAPGVRGPPGVVGPKGEPGAAGPQGTKGERVGSKLKDPVCKKFWREPTEDGSYYDPCALCSYTVCENRSNRRKNNVLSDLTKKKKS